MVGERSVVVLVGLAAEFAQAILDCHDRAVDVHVDLDGLHLWCVELEQAQLCIDTLVRAERYHVGLEVRYVEREP